MGLLNHESPTTPSSATRHALYSRRFSVRGMRTVLPNPIKCRRLLLAQKTPARIDAKINSSYFAPGYSDLSHSYHGSSLAMQSTLPYDNRMWAILLVLLLVGCSAHARSTDSICTVIRHSNGTETDVTPKSSPILYVTKACDQVYTWTCWTL